MKHPWLFRTSILLNLVLLGIGAWWLADRPTPSPQPALTVSNEPIPAPSAPTPAFRWSQLEAGDYPTYIARLRAIGCPEETIRDLITADVASQYEEKRRRLLAANPSQSGEPVSPTAPPRVLEPNPSSAGGSSVSLAAGDHSAASEPNARMLQSLAQEQAALLSTLLPTPPSANKAAPVASDATGKTAAIGPLPTATPARPSTTDTLPRSMEREMRQRGVLTHEQEVLRAKVGWQAFYYTTAEANVQERAAGNAR